MKRMQISKPAEDNVCSESTYIVNSILPIVIKEVSEQMFSVLFLIKNNLVDESNYLVMYFAYDNESDIKFIKSHNLNYNNIANNPKQLKLYLEMTKDLDNSRIFSTDMDLVLNKEKKAFYKGYAYRISNLNNNIEQMELIINHTIFVQINVFLLRFFNRDITAETTFFDYTLKNVEFVTLTNIKLDGSTKTPNENYINNHYTAKAGYNVYRFHFISPSIFGRRLRNPMGYEPYCALYGNDYIVDTMFFDHNSDTLFVIFVEKDQITNKYKRTLALKLSKELYNHTNFLDYYKIYEQIKEN